MHEETTQARLDRLTKIDLQHLWHPFTQGTVWLDDASPLIIDRGEGCELIDVEGTRYLDGVSSLWCNVHGHGEPQMVAAMQQQVAKLCHSTLLGLSHVPILELTAALLPLLPKNLSRVFYADSGSTAVEASLRIAMEWWQKQGTPAALKRRRIASLLGSYHGDTLGAVGVGYLEQFHRHLNSLLVKAPRVPPPHIFRIEEQYSNEQALEAAISALKRFFSHEADTLAAFIIEPLVQGAAGIWTHPPEFLREVSELCRKYDVLLIADEVATGFGKTGSMFAVELAGVEPDILLLGKGLSGGLLPISAAVTTDRLFEGFLGRPEEYKTFFYGQTFAGNPLAAAAALANLQLFQTTDLLTQMRNRIPLFHEMLEAQIASLAHVFEVRRNGLMIGIELTAKPGEFEPFQTAQQVGPKIVKAARSRGAIIRPLGNVMVLMPPLAMNESQLERLVQITAESISAVLED